MRPDPVERRRGRADAPQCPNGPYLRQDQELRRRGRRPRKRPLHLHNSLRALRSRRLRRAPGADLGVKLYSAQEMSRADSAAQELGIPGGVLMERAGVEMARATLDFFGPLEGRRVLVVA